jgi:hypothetical protein
MAEYVVDLLVQYLSQQLEKEGNFFGGVEDQVKSLHRELRLINIFLENVRCKRERCFNHEQEKMKSCFGILTKTVCVSLIFIDDYKRVNIHFKWSKTSVQSRKLRCIYRLWNVN